MEMFTTEDTSFLITVNERIISTKLRNLRTGAGISLEEFAEALGVENSELKAYEDGSQDVPASVIAMVCTLAGVPYEYFFDDSISSIMPEPVIIESGSVKHEEILN